MFLFDLQLKKPNLHLDMKSGSPKFIEVRPHAKYNLQFGPVRLNASRPWVTLGNETDHEDLHTFRVAFNSSTIKDGTQLEATLTFGATAVENDVQAEDATIQLSAVMQCTPSPTRSIMRIDSGKEEGIEIALRAIEITQGREARVEVEAIDDDGIGIDESRGRFMDITWKTPNGNSGTRSTSFKADPPRFFLTLTHLDLNENGDYKVETHARTRTHARTHPRTQPRTVSGLGQQNIWI